MFEESFFVKIGTERNDYRLIYTTKTTDQGCTNF